MRLLIAVFALATATTFWGCSSVKVTTDYDKTTDFSQYETYSFLGWQDDSDQVMNELDRNRVREAFKAEFAKRNLEYIDKGGNMAITLYFVVKQETSITSYTNYYGGGRGRYHRGGGWGMGASTTTYNQEDYMKGTMVVDTYDEKSGDLVWQGVATSTIKENPEKREKSIPKRIGALMAKFPVSPVK